MKKLTLILLLFTANLESIDAIVPTRNSSDEANNVKHGEVDIQRKIKESRQLTINAAKFFLNNSIEVACGEFIHNPKWRKGELFPLVIREDGVILAHGDDFELLWTNMSKDKGVGGKPLLQDMLAQKKVGTLSYLKDNAYKTSQVTVVNKHGTSYIIASGFYPENDEYATKQIVLSASGYFDREGKEATFALINNPNGPFVKGDIYTFAYDFNGVCVAHGHNTALIGQNLIDLVDSRKKPIIKDLIEIAKTKGSGWLSYEWQNAAKRSFVMKVEDKITKTPYLISAGYYPRTNLSTVQRFVSKAHSYLKTHGAKDAFSEFNNSVGEFSVGGLTIFVYDFEGKCLANGDNPGFVGQNLIKETDSEGKLIVIEMIKIARKYGKGTIPLISKNAYTIAYVEKVDVPDGKFIIGSVFHPSSKVQSVKALVSRAMEALKSAPTTAQVFESFSNKKGSYYRGDLSVFVYDTKGTRYVNGGNKSQIWKNFMKVSDQDGKAIVGDLIAKAINGGGWAEYQTRNAIRRVYAKVVNVSSKNGENQTFVVGSGYFL